MQGVAGAELSVVLMALAAGVVAGALLSLVAMRLRERMRPTSEPLGGLFQKPAFAEHRSAPVARLSAADDADITNESTVLRARIDHLDEVSEVWTRGTRAEAIEQVAQVMRAGVRKGDRVEPIASETSSPANEGSFAIHAAGATKADAGAIARRLINKMADMPVPNTGARLSARIEVEPDQWEEIKLLPAPAASTTPMKGADAA